MHTIELLLQSGHTETITLTNEDSITEIEAHWADAKTNHLATFNGPLKIQDAKTGSTLTIYPAQIVAIREHDDPKSSGFHYTGDAITINKTAAENVAASIVYASAAYKTQTSDHYSNAHFDSSKP